MGTSLFKHKQHSPKVLLKKIKENPSYARLLQLQEKTSLLNLFNEIKINKILTLLVFSSNYELPLVF